MRGTVERDVIGLGGRKGREGCDMVVWEER